MEEGTIKHQRTETDGIARPRVVLPVNQTVRLPRLDHLELVNEAVERLSRSANDEIFDRFENGIDVSFQSSMKETARVHGALKVVNQDYDSPDLLLDRYVMLLGSLLVLFENENDVYCDCAADVDGCDVWRLSFATEFYAFFHLHVTRFFIGGKVRRDVTISIGCDSTADLDRWIGAISGVASGSTIHDSALHVSDLRKEQGADGSLFGQLRRLEDEQERLFIMHFLTKTGLVKKLPVNYMRRKHRLKYGWKTRYFVLEPKEGRIYYYASPKLKKLKGEINFLVPDLVVEDNARYGGKTGFQIHCGSSASFYCAARTAVEKKEWIAVIKRVWERFVGSSNVGKCPTPTDHVVATDAPRGRTEDPNPVPVLPTNWDDAGADDDEDDASPYASADEDEGQKPGTEFKVAETQKRSFRDSMIIPLEKSLARLKWLHVKIIEGKKLAVKDISGSSDPYCTLALAGNRLRKTEVVVQSVNPKWERSSFVFDVRSVSHDLRIDVFDWDRFKTDDYLGNVTIPVLRVANGLVHDLWLPLQPDPVKFPNEYVCGELHMELWVENANTDDEPAPKENRVAVDTSGWPGIDDEYESSAVVSSVSTRAWYSAALTKEQELFVWGREPARGSSFSIDSTRPQLLTAPPPTPTPRWIAVSCGKGHLLAIDESRDIYGWGAFPVGDSFRSPKLIPFGDGKVKLVRAGENSSAVVTDFGRLYLWGKGDHGKLGCGDSMSRLVPTMISSVRGVCDVALGDDHSLVVTEHGALFSCGRTLFGLLGLGNSCMDQIQVPSFTRISALEDVKVRSVVAARHHSLCIDSQGNLYSWGWGHGNRLGHGHSSSELAPTAVEFSESEPVFIVSAAASMMNSAAVSDRGEVFVWGACCFGLLGSGSRKDCPARRPLRVTALSGRQIVSVSLGMLHGVALSREGRVYTWGVAFASLGHGVPTNNLEWPNLREPRCVRWERDCVLNRLRSRSPSPSPSSSPSSSNGSSGSRPMSPLSAVVTPTYADAPAVTSVGILSSEGPFSVSAAESPTETGDENAGSASKARKLPRKPMDPPPPLPEGIIRRRKRNATVSGTSLSAREPLLAARQNHLAQREQASQGQLLPLPPFPRPRRPSQPAPVRRDGLGGT